MVLEVEPGEVERMKLEEGGEREKEGDNWGGVQGKERRRREEKMQREECERERQMPPVRPQGGGAVLGRWRTEESGARCALDKLGWSGAAPGRGPEKRI